MVLGLVTGMLYSFGMDSGGICYRNFTYFCSGYWNVLITGILYGFANIIVNIVEVAFGLVFAIYLEIYDALKIDIQA